MRSRLQNTPDNRSINYPVLDTTMVFDVNKAGMLSQTNITFEKLRHVLIGSTLGGLVTKRAFAIGRTFWHLPAWLLSVIGCRRRAGIVTCPVMPVMIATFLFLGASLTVELTFSGPEHWAIFNRLRFNYGELINRVQVGKNESAGVFTVRVPTPRRV